MQQWIYTTSCWNLNLQSGWNTFSHSDGLTAAEVEELEQKCQLQAGLPAEDFPVFCVLTLSTGRRVICQSAYIGKSFYDGRPGATFTHAYILEKDEQLPLPPVSYMGSPSFLSSLSEETQQKALYYREHRSEMVPPPHLPTVSPESLIANEAQSAVAIQARLMEPAFAGRVSRIISCRESLRTEQLPLRFRAVQGEYAPLLAALFYMVPEYFGNGSFSSLCCTDSGVALYSFFSIVGTKDSNYHIDVTEDLHSSTALHPLVRCARENLTDWYTFTTRFGQQTSGCDAKLFLFDLATRRETEYLSESDIHRIAGLMSAAECAVAPKDWCLMLSRYAAFDFTGEIGVKTAGSILCMVASPAVFADMSEAQRVDCRRLMQRVLFSLSECLNAGRVALPLLQRTLNAVPLSVKLWLSAPMQQRLLDCKDVSKVPWQTVALSLALQGQEKMLWENGAEAKRLYTLCVDSPEAFARYLGCFPSAVRVTLYIMQQGEESGLPVAVRDAYLAYAAALSLREQHESMRILLEGAWYHTAAAAFLRTCGARPDYHLLAEAAETAAAYPEYEALVLPTLLQTVPSVPYTKSQGEKLLQTAKRSGESYRAAWQSCLLKGFPTDSLIDTSLINMAAGVVSLNEQVEDGLRTIFNYCRMLVLLGTLPEVGISLAPKLRAFTSPGSPYFIGMKDKNKVDDRILSYLLLYAQQGNSFAQWLNPSIWGWDSTTLLIAIQGFCESRIREYRQYRFDERGLSFLQAVLGVKDYLPVGSPERDLAPLFFRGVTSREKKAILRSCSGDAVWLKSCMGQHTESFAHKILSFLTFKK